MADSKKQPEPKQMQELKAERQLLCTRFSPDGTHLLAGGMDANVHRWREGEVMVEKKEKSKDGDGLLGCRHHLQVAKGPLFLNTGLLLEGRL